MAVDGRTLLITFALDFGIGLASFLIFSTLRIVGPTRAFYNPRWYYCTRPAEPPWAGPDHAATAPAAAGDQPVTPEEHTAVQQHLQQQHQQQQQQQQQHGQDSAVKAAHSVMSSDAGPQTAVAHAAAAAAAGKQPGSAEAAASSAAVFEAGMDDETGLAGVPPFWAPLPPKLPSTVLTWIWPLVRMSETKLIEAVGLDAAMLLRFIRFAIILLLVLSVWCIGVVLPINLQGNNVEAVANIVPVNALPSPASQKQQNLQLIPNLDLFGSSAQNRSSSQGRSQGSVGVGPGQDVQSVAQDITEGRYMASDLDKFSLANIPNGSQLLWVHVASVYVVTAITLALLWHASASAMRLYLAHLATPSASTAGATHTAILRDIPGVSRGTVLDQLFHSWLFKLVPPPLKRRLAKAWNVRYGGGASTPTAALDRVFKKQHDRDDRQLHQQQKQQQKRHARHSKGHGKSAAAAAGPVAEGTEQPALLPSDGQQQPSSSSSSSSSSSNDLSHRGRLRDTTAQQWPSLGPAAGLQMQMQQQQQQQEQQERDQVSIVIPPVSDTPASSAPFATATSTRHRKVRVAAGIDSPHQQQQQQQQQLEGVAASGASSSLVTVRSRDDLLAEQQQRVLHGEWNRAAKALGNGVSLQEFVQREFTTVYGPKNISAVHMVTYSPRTAKLVQQYNNTRSSLHDLLDHCNTQLCRAAAAAAAAAEAARRRQQQQQRKLAGGGVVQGASQPFKAVGRALSIVPPELPKYVTGTGSSSSSSGGGSSDGADSRHGSNGGGLRSSGGSSGGRRWLRKGKIRPIEIIKLPLPDPAKYTLPEHQHPADASARIYSGSSSSTHPGSADSSAGAAAAAAAAAVKPGPAAIAHSAATVTADQDSMPAGVAERGYLQSAEESWPRGLPFPSYLAGWEDLLPGQQQHQQQQQLGREPAGQQQQQQQQGTVFGNPLFALDHTFSTGPSPAQDHPQLPQDIIGTHSTPQHSNGPLLHNTSAAAAAPSGAHPATAPAAALGRPQQPPVAGYRPGRRSDSSSSSSSSSSSRSFDSLDVNGCDVPCFGGQSKQPPSTAASTAAVAADSSRAPVLNGAPAGPAAVDPPQQTQGAVTVPLVALGGTGPATISNSSRRGSQDWPHGNSSSDGSGSDGGGSDADSLDVNGWDLPCGGCGKPKGDALDVLLLRMQNTRAELADAQAADARDPYPAALVTFRTRTALAAAVGAHHVAEAGAWSLQAAPPPDSIMWSQVGLKGWQVSYRRTRVFAVLVVVAFFYIFPVGVVQGILQVEQLERIAVINTLVSIPVVRSLLLGVLPGLALRIFVLLLPVLLYAVNRRAGSVGQAEMDGHVATQFFSLQVVVVFFASFITGSLLNQLALLLNNPGDVLKLLGTGVPQTSTFFMLYIIFSAFIGRSLSLLRPWGLFMTACRLAASKNSGKRGRRRAVLLGTYRMFGPAIPSHSIILLLSVVYSVIQPFVLLCGLVFFLMALVVESYNWGWVFRRPYEGGGELWQQVFRQVIITLYLFQAIMIALLGVKQFLWVVLLVIPVLLTVFVHRLGAGYLQRSWGIMSMRAAYELDVADAAHQQQQQHLTGRELSDRPWDEPHLQPNPHSSSSSSSSSSSEDNRLQPAHGSAASLSVAGNLAGDGSLSAAWGELYRPPGQRMLLLGPKIEARLAEQVAVVKRRLAEHNARAGKR